MTGLRLLRYLGLIVALAACGDSTEPQPVQHADASGSWTYSATYAVNLGPLGASACSGSGVQATITQSGSSVSGTAHGGEWTCDSLPFAIEPFPSDDPGQVRGTVDGTSVQFEVDGFVLLVHEGTVSGNSMSGSVTGTGNLTGVGSISITGNWSASR